MSAIPLRRVGPAVVCALVAAVGCSSGPKRVPVSGSVTLDGKPLNAGVIHFYPDPDKGNPHRVDCLSPCRDGRYNLLTTAVRDSESGDGAPVGWYKVYLYTDVPGFDQKIHSRFTDPARTTILVEVVEKPEPGQYDIDFKSN
jgi:hypothetical protein